MERTWPLLLPVLIVLIPSCQKDDDGPGPDLPIETCGMDGARMKADVDGSATCFSTSLFGSLADGQLAIGGLNLSGSSLAIQLDETGPGTHVASEALNHVLLVAAGIGYQSSNTVPGSITISAHDEGNNRIKGTFSLQVFPAESGTPKNVSGSFDVTYIEE